MLLLAPLVGVALSACGPRDQHVQLRFMLEEGTAVDRLQFYVHDIRLVDEAGAAHSFALTSRLPWQHERVALLELVPARRDIVEGSVPPRRYTGVAFSVGVPFDLNHANPLTAGAPLDRAEMFWSWQSGYKFLRLDLTAGEHEAAFHLGSTGCSSASALRRPQAPCAQPNVIHVVLEGIDPITEPIRVRVGDVVAALADEQRVCTGDYEQTACALAYATTGLDAETGQCGGRANGAGCEQTWFAVPADVRSAGHAP